MDAEEFVVTTSGHGKYRYTWTSGRNRDYGFNSFSNDRCALPAEHHARSIRNFLGMIDPSTGFIEEDDA